MKNMVKAMTRVENATQRRATTLDSVSSISSDGKTVNSQTYGNSELVELKVLLPYGMASSLLDGMQVQIIINSNGDGNNVVVGTYDPDRPDMNPGEVALYNKNGSMIYLKNNGDIELTPASGKVLVNGTITQTP